MFDFIEDLFDRRGRTGHNRHRGGLRGLFSRVLGGDGRVRSSRTDEDGDEDDRRTGRARDKRRRDRDLFDDD